MAHNKPGRILFWVSIVSFTIGWWAALTIPAKQLTPDMAVGVLFLWGVSVLTGVLWLKVKWTQTKARAARAGWDHAAGR